MGQLGKPYKIVRLVFLLSESFHLFITVHLWPLPCLAVKCAILGEPPEILRPARLDDRLQHPAEKPVMFSEALDQVVGAAFSGWPLK